MNAIPWHLRREDRTCAREGCGVVFTPAREASRWCSNGCRIEHNNAQRQRHAIRPRLRERECLECHTPFAPIRQDQVFCCKGCKNAEHNRELTRAKLIYRELYHWRLGYGKGVAGSFFNMASQQVSEWIAEDKRQGRKPPPLNDRGPDERKRVRRAA